jgi:hypothetical protein
MVKITKADHAGCSKRPFSKAAADGSTGGVAFLTRPPELPRQLASQVGYVEDAFEVRTMHGKRFVSASRGWVGEKGGFFSIPL